MKKLSNVVVCLGLFFILFTSFAAASSKEVPVREGNDVVVKLETVIATIKDVPAAMPAQAAWDLQQGKIGEWKAPVQYANCQDKIGLPISTECKQLQTVYQYSEGKFSSKTENLPPIIVQQMVMTIFMYINLFSVLIYGPAYVYHKRRSNNFSRLVLSFASAGSIVFACVNILTVVLSKDWLLLGMYLFWFVLCSGISYCLALIMGLMWKKKLPEEQEVIAE